MEGEYPLFRIDHLPSMQKLLNYFKDSVNELKLVTWPKQEDTMRLTITTIIFVLTIALILGVVDFSLTKAYQWFLTLAP